MIDRRRECRELADRAVFARPSARTALRDHGSFATLHADTWVFTDDLAIVLLIHHPARGWVPPGGKVEPGESVMAAATRELSEETGVTVDTARLEAAWLTHSHDDATGEHAFTAAYAACLERRMPLRTEAGLDGAAWWSLDERWPSIYPYDRVRLRAWARAERLGRQRAGPPARPRDVRSPEGPA